MMIRKKIEPANEGNAFQKFAAKVNSTLIRFIGKVEMLSRSYQKEPSLKALLLVIGFSFLYGVLHVVGPGHGKTVLTSYLISRRISIRKGLAMAGGVAFSHILMAVLVVFLLFIIFQAASISNVESAKKTLTYVSGGMILGIGLFFLIQAIRELFHKHNEGPEAHVHAGHEQHEGGHTHSHGDENVSGKGVLGLIVSIGIVPCPGPISILIFSLYAKIFYIGLVSALAMAVGMGATYSLAVVTVLGFKKLTLGGGGTFGRVLHTFYEFVGAFVILTIGTLVLFSNARIS